MKMPIISNILKTNFLDTIVETPIIHVKVWISVFWDRCRKVTECSLSLHFQRVFHHLLHIFLLFAHFYLTIILKEDCVSKILPWKACLPIVPYKNLQDAFHLHIQNKAKEKCSHCLIGPLFSALKWRDLNIFSIICLCHHGPLFLGHAPGCE